MFCRPGLLAAALLSLAACRSPPGRSSAPPAASVNAAQPPRPLEKTPPSPAGESASTPPAPPAPSTLPPSAPDGELRLGILDDKTPGTIAATSWLAAHGISRFPEPLDRLTGCRVVRLGDPPRDGLLCEGGGPPMRGSFPSGESLFPFTVWAADAGALRVALEAPIAAGPLDWDDPLDTADPDGGMYVRLNATLGPDGATLDILERPGKGCAEALKAFASPELIRHRAVIRTACAAAGHYRWSAGRFVRAAPPRASAGVSGF
jgi:hypothetical protein